MRVTLAQTQCQHHLEEIISSSREKPLVIFKEYCRGYRLSNNKRIRAFNDKPDISHDRQSAV
jgi:hypothetical protein